MGYLKYIIISIVLIMALSTLAVAENPAMDRSASQGGLPGTTVTVVDRPEGNPLLPTQQYSKEEGWLSQVTEIRNKYHLRRKHIVENYENKFEALDAYSLLRIDRYNSKTDFISGFRKAEEAHAAIYHYRHSSDLNDKHFIQAFQHINASPDTRKKLIEVLSKNMNSPKEESQRRLILLEEKLFSRLLSLYRLMASNATMWDIKSGSFIFKNDKLKGKYIERELKLNDTIRKLQSQRELEKETG